MGYSKSKSAVGKVKPVLDSMLVNTGDFIQPSSVPDELAYALREAKYVIQLYPNLFKEYESVINKYTIKVKKDHLLFTRKHDLIAGPPIAVTPAGLATARTLTLLEVVTVLQAVGAAIQHKADEMVFPNLIETEFNRSEFDRMRTWASNSGYYIKSVNPLTLIKVAT